MVPQSQQQGEFREPGVVRQRSLMARLTRAGVRLFTAPFSDDLELATLPIEMRERLRHAALLRLIITCLLAVQIVVAIPASVLNGSPLGDIVLQGAIVAFGALCLALNQRGWTTLASALYIYPPMAAIFGTILQNPGGLDFRAVLLYSAASVLILITGLLLPTPYIWLTLALALGADVWGVSTLPLAPAVTHLATGELTRVLVGAILAVSYILTALLTWVFARSARSGIDAVARAFERERELIQLKDQFIIDANHELRTPIMTLYNNLELLNIALERGDKQRSARLMRRALDSGDAVLRLLRNVLDTSALESKAPRIEPSAIALRPAVRAVLETFDPAEIGELSLPQGVYEARAVTEDIPDELMVRADEARLRQVLINLLSNALKYSAPGTPIEIAAHALTARQASASSRWRKAASSTQPGLAQLSIRDHGLGIPARDIPKLFNRFVRLERDIAGPVRGTGVGLYLCRILVEAMGGRIWVESAGVPGKGSTFTFTLPLAAREDVAQPPESTDESLVVVADVAPAEENTPAS